MQCPVCVFSEISQRGLCLKHVLNVTVELFLQEIKIHYSKNNKTKQNQSPNFWSECITRVKKYSAFCLNTFTKFHNKQRFLGAALNDLIRL